MAYALSALAGYLLGSIPWGVLVSRLTRGIDVRDYGSGSMGMTNVLRTLGPVPAVLVFLGDMLKGVAAVLVARAVSDAPAAAAVAGFAAVAGHTWPVWLRFRGGRGLATGLGAQTAMVPWAALIGFSAAFVPLVALTRYISLGSIGSVVGALVANALFVALGWQPVAYLLYTCCAGGLIVWNHRGNIQRLLKGKERRLGQRLDVPPPASEQGQAR